MSGLIDPFTATTGISAVWVAILAIWEAVWTGLAMWRAAKRREVWWFIIFLVINLLGIPEIIYLLLTNKKKGTAVQKRSRR